MKSQEIKNNLLSKDTTTVLNTVHDILYMATMNTLERESLLNDAYNNLEVIKKNIKDMDFGGAILPNKRFIDKAIRIIETSKDGKCKCEEAFDGFGQNEGALNQYYGFILHSHVPDGYIHRTIMECPCCHTFYECEDEYTGWHVNTFRYRKLCLDDFKVQRFQKYYVFLYESESTLKRNLEMYGIDERDLDEPIKPSCGTIFVGNDATKDWIRQRKCFYGWDIQFCDCLTSEIRFQ